MFKNVIFWFPYLQLFYKPLQISCQNSHYFCCNFHHTTECLKMLYSDFHTYNYSINDLAKFRFRCINETHKRTQVPLPVSYLKHTYRFQAKRSYYLLLNINCYMYRCKKHGRKNQLLSNRQASNTITRTATKTLSYRLFHLSDSD